MFIRCCMVFVVASSVTLSGDLEFAHGGTAAELHHVTPLVSTPSTGGVFSQRSSIAGAMLPKRATATASSRTTPHPKATVTATRVPSRSVQRTPPRRPTTSIRLCAGANPPCAGNAVLPGTLLIADRGNSRLIEVNAAKHVLWTFPRPGDLRPGQAFQGPDDAFFTPDRRSIITNQEEAQTVGLIDHRSHRLVWQYGHLGIRGSAPGYLNEPDDAYQRRDGLVTVADIRNCRIVFLSRAGNVVRQYGQTGVCVHNPPYTFASPNGDTPLSDGGMLVTEIGGSHVVRLSARGTVVFDITVPWVSYPSDAQLLADGTILLSDYSYDGGIVRVSASGRLLWRYTPTRAIDRLNHPSLAIMLPNGLIATNDDWNHRVLLIDPRRNSIVWQYGITGAAGVSPGYLNIPDGIDFRQTGT